MILEPNKWKIGAELKIKTALFTEQMLNLQGKVSQ